MRVVLKQEVRGLGRPGEVKEVADGYAQNFLLPKGLAIEASAGELRRGAQERASAQAKQDRAPSDALALPKRLDAVTLVVTPKAGEQGKTFGSVTTKEIADALKREHKIDVDPRKIQAEPLRALGVHRIEVRLAGDVRGRVAVAIEPA